jgi:dTDP-glucose 4,6-dehydratase
MRLLITGGAGFIGSHVLRYFLQNYHEYSIVCVDNLTYAGNYNAISEYNSLPNYRFENIDICNSKEIHKIFDEYNFTHVIHLAAETHVDNSIKDPLLFAKTNILGTINLLQAANRLWSGENNNLFYHISTDEVYGSLDSKEKFTEYSPYNPRSPYSASKASSDHFVRAYGETYGLPYLISNCSNNYGPGQNEEKLIPKVISSLLKGKKIPLYGDGSNVRDWLFIDDHVQAIDQIFHFGVKSNTYCIGGNCERSNLELIFDIIDILMERSIIQVSAREELISFVKDRKGHDRRYAINFEKLNRHLGWSPKIPLKEGLNRTIDYYQQVF